MILQMKRFFFIVFLVTGTVSVSEQGFAHGDSEAFYPKGEKWRITVPKPREPVAFTDYEPKIDADATAQTLRAEFLLRQADQSKRDKEYEVAEKLYLQSLETNSALVQARYQLACNYALWGKKELASETFRKAFEDGFSDYSFSKDDDELGVVRSEADFEARLSIIRERYLSELEKHVGTPVYAAPKGIAKPPLIILLHGFGDTNENYFDFFEQWTDPGFLVVAMPGSLPQLGGRAFTWSTDSVKETQDQLVAVLESDALKEKFDSSRVYLLGFSQGAMHAMQIVMMSPERFHGAVAISPGGRPWNRGAGYSLDPPKTKQKIWFIHGAEESLDPAIRKWSGECRKAGWSVEVTQHDGAHHFPRDWDTLQPKVAAFLLK